MLTLMLQANCQKIRGGGVSKSGDAIGDENLGVYDFKDNKMTGTVTVTEVWDDDKTNEERTIPDIKISTAKPGKIHLVIQLRFMVIKMPGWCLMMVAM